MKRVLSSILILVILLTAVACPRVDSVNSNYTPNPTTGSNSSAEKIQINHSVAEAIATVSSLESVKRMPKMLLIQFSQKQYQ